jgi:insulysin
MFVYDIILIVLQETYLKDYENFKFSQPYSQAGYYLYLMLNDRSWPQNENLEALSHLGAEDLANFVSYLLSRTFLECFVSGVAPFTIFIPSKKQYCTHDP